MQLSVVVRSLPRACPERCVAALPLGKAATSVEASDDEAERCCAVAPPRSHLRRKAPLGALLAHWRQPAQLVACRPMQECKMHHGSTACLVGAKPPTSQIWHRSYGGHPPCRSTQVGMVKAGGGEGRNEFHPVVDLQNMSCFSCPPLSCHTF